MFERFTERARQVVILSQDEARAMKHTFIGTEHLLLGLLREEEGIAARVLLALGITVDELRAEIRRRMGEGNEVTTGQIPFTPSAKKALELSLREALSLGHNYIGTEHVLLGLTRLIDGEAIILSDYVDAANVRDAVVRMLSGTRRHAVETTLSLTPAELEWVHRAAGARPHTEPIPGAIYAKAGFALGALKESA